MWIFLHRGQRSSRRQASLFPFGINIEMSSFSNGGYLAQLVVGIFFLQPTWRWCRGGIPGEGETTKLANSSNFAAIFGSLLLGRWCNFSCSENVGFSKLELIVPTWYGIIAGPFSGKSPPGEEEEAEMTSSVPFSRFVFTWFLYFCSSPEFLFIEQLIREDGRCRRKWRQKNDAFLSKIVGHRRPRLPPTYFPIPLSTTQQLTRHSLKYFPINS